MVARGRVRKRDSAQLRAWADSLQNSAIAGPRHLNDHTRAQFEKRQARESGAAAFQAALRQHLPTEHPLLKSQPPAPKPRK